MGELAPTPPEQSPETRQQPQRRLRLRWLLPVGLLAAAGIAGGIWYLWLRPEPEPVLRVSGRIEGHETEIGTEVGGCVVAVAAREGDRVEQGEMLVRLEAATARAQLEGANARLEAARRQAKQASATVASLKKQIREAQLVLAQSRQSSQGQTEGAQAQSATAQAQHQQARAQHQQARSELQLARKERERFAFLHQQGAVSQQRFDQTQTQLETARAAVQNRQDALEAAKRQVEAAQGKLTQASSSQLEPDIRQAQLERLQAELERARQQRAAAQAEIASAQAARQERQTQLDDFKIASPETGVAIARSVEPGAVVAPGQTLLTVLDGDTVYLRGYVPEGDIGKVRVGQQARVYLDSAPEQPIEARVSKIDAEASFTPENIYFQQDRVRQAFGVRIAIENPQGFAKPGMPADAEIVLGHGARNTARN